MRLLAGAIGFALMVAYWPSFSGLATTPRWDVAVVMAAVLMFAPPARMTPTHWAGLALILWLILSLTWSDGQPYGVDASWKLLAIVAAFALGATITDLTPLIAGAAVGLALSSAIAIAQWFGWHGIESAASPAGLFWNGNRLAEVAVLVFAAALALRMWWALPGLVPAIVIPYDRAAWLAASIVAAVWIWRRIGKFERFVTAISAAWLVIGLALVATAWRTEQFGLNGIAERIELWRFTLANLSWLGHGLGSFSADAPLFAWHGAITSRATHPHNEWLWLAYEGGLPAIGLFGGFAVLLARAAVHAGRASGSAPGSVGISGCLSRCAGEGGLVLIAIALIACVAMPFHDPATVLFAAAVAGHVAGAGGGVRDAADLGGSLLREGHGRSDRDWVGDVGPRAGAGAVSI